MADKPTYEEYYQAVYWDPNSIYHGTGFMYGTLDKPVSNVEDAKIIADRVGATMIIKVGMFLIDEENESIESLQKEIEQYRQEIRKIKKQIAQKQLKMVGKILNEN